MNYYGVKRVSGKGYENKNVIVKKRRRADAPFLFFSLLFGGAVYLIASALFHALSFPNRASAVISLLF